MADSEASLGGLFALGEEMQAHKRALADRLSDIKFRGQLAPLRRLHKVPEWLNEVEAWVWIGLVFAEKHPPPKKRGPKPGARDRKQDEGDQRVLAAIESAVQAGYNFDMALSRAIKLAEDRDILTIAEDRTTNPKRLRRKYTRQLAERARMNVALATALMGHNSRKK